jgi:hypothetical protein
MNEKTNKDGHPTSFAFLSSPFYFLQHQKDSGAGRSGSRFIPHRYVPQSVYICGMLGSWLGSWLGDGKQRPREREKRESLFFKNAWTSGSAR